MIHYLCKKHEVGHRLVMTTGGRFIPEDETRTRRCCKCDKTLPCRAFKATKAITKTMQCPFATSDLS